MGPCTPIFCNACWILELDSFDFNLPAILFGTISSNETTKSIIIISFWNLCCQCRLMSYYRFVYCIFIADMVWKVYLNGGFCLFSDIFYSVSISERYRFYKLPVCLHAPLIVVCSDWIRITILKFSTSPKKLNVKLLLHLLWDYSLSSYCIVWRFSRCLSISILNAYSSFIPDGWHVFINRTAENMFWTSVMTWSTFPYTKWL